MTNEEQEMFSYDFIINIDSYEPKLKFGLTFVELTAAGIALVFPMLLFQSVLGALLGVLLGGVVLLALKRFIRLGNLSIPVYLGKRIQLAYRAEPIIVAQMVPAVRAAVTVTDYQGEHVATYR